MRRTTIVLAVALAGATLAAACGGGSPGTSGTTEAAATESDAPTDVTTEEHDATTDEHAETATGEAGGGADVKASIVLVDGEPEGGPVTIEATKGQTVRIVVRSDQPDEVHLHGYDVEQAASPGAPAVFRLTADLEGIFELESHVTETVIARLVVNP